MADSNWRLTARAAIQNAIASLPPNASPQQIKKAIDAAYPFGMRKYHPYKIWLSERKAYLLILGVPVPARKKEPEQSDSKGVQQTLFN